MTEQSPFRHPEFDALASDSPYMTSDVQWPPQASRHGVANGAPWRGGEATPAQIITTELFPNVDDRDAVHHVVKGLIDGTPIAGSQQAAAVLALSAYLAARVGWQVVPPESVPQGEEHGQ